MFEMWIPDVLNFRMNYYQTPIMYPMNYSEYIAGTSTVVTVWWMKGIIQYRNISLWTLLHVLCKIYWLRSNYISQQYY
jgi:hypothetical protein